VTAAPVRDIAEVEEAIEGAQGLPVGIRAGLR